VTGVVADVDGITQQLHKAVRVADSGSQSGLFLVFAALALIIMDCDLKIE
jgi:hypothetical protein